MKRPTDEILVAYADGRLSTAEADLVASYLAGDEEARRFTVALKASADLVREAFEEPVNAQPSRLLADMIMAAPPHPAQRDTVVAMPTRASGSTNRRWERMAWKPMAMAASVALVVGIAAGSLLLPRPGADSVSPLTLGPVSPSGIFHGVLERRSTGDTIALETESRPRQKLSMIATFRDRLERPCREVELVADTPDASPIAAAVACRANDGRWIVEGAMRVATTDASTGDGTFYPSGIRDKDAIDGLLSLLGASKSLAAAEERELMARGWKK